MPGLSVTAEGINRKALQIGVRGRFARWHFRHRQAVEAWLILSPILVYYIIFHVFPIFANLYISFTRWDGISGAPQWVGFQNYLRYLRPPYPGIIANTLILSVSILLVKTSLALLFALLLNQKIAALGLFRTLWYLPTLTIAAVVAQLTMVLISPYDGILNLILQSMGREPVIWTLSTFWMRAFIILGSVWRAVGSSLILFLAALQGIHLELYEAAHCDGASGRHTLRFITIPLIKPMIIFVLITGMIGSFQIFEFVLLMTHGGPATGTNVMLLQIYLDAFANLRMGRAAAGSIVMAIMLLWFSIWNIRILSRGQVEN